jgi:hypothetical protein
MNKLKPCPFCGTEHSDDWETCMQQECDELQIWEKEDYNDYWFEYNVCGERANDTQILL